MNFNFVKGNRSTKVDVNAPKEKLVLNLSGRTVVKLKAGDKYVITKTGNIEWLCRELGNTLARYVDGQLPKDNLYYKLVKHIFDFGIKDITVQFLFNSDSGYEVLKFEQDQLDKFYGKKACLNIHRTSYMPRTVNKDQIPISLWLKVNESLNFYKLLKKRGLDPES
jgi:hypothetical protein